MKTLVLELPDHVAFDEQEAKIILAGELYERGRLSLGQAADLAGLSKRAFVEVMGTYGYSVFSTSIEDVAADIRNA